MKNKGKSAWKKLHITVRVRFSPFLLLKNKQERE